VGKLRTKKNGTPLKDIRGERRREISINMRVMLSLNGRHSSLQQLLQPRRLKRKGRVAGGEGFRRRGDSRKRNVYLTTLMTTHGGKRKRVREEATADSRLIESWGEEG